MKSLIGLLVFVAFTVSAETETVKEMAPYENDVDWNGFWSTTGHVDTVASSAMADFSSSVTMSVPSVFTVFDTRTTTMDWDDADVTIDTVTQYGFLLFLR